MNEGTETKRYFTDSPIEIASFKGIAISESVVINDSSVSTAAIESLDRSSQTTEQQHVEIQTEKQLVQKTADYDEPALLDFLRRCAPIVELELRKKNKYFGMDFQQLIMEDDEITTKKITTLSKHVNITDEMSSLRISWSVYGNKIAVSYGSKKHESWCKHTSFILIYETDKNEEFTKEAKICLEAYTCVVDMKFHPSMNSVLVFATDEGKIYWHSTVDTLENNSKNHLYHPGAKITQISWVELNLFFYLVIADADGFLYFWITSSFIQDWNLWRKITFRNSNDINERAILCFDFSPLNCQHFVIGLEGGKLLQCSTDLVLTKGDRTSNPVIRDFECSCLLITSVRFSIFEDNVFVISGNDEFLRVYYLNEKAAVFTIATNCIPIGIEWSHLQDNILLSWSENDVISFYNYQKSALVKSMSLEKKIQAVGLKVKGMKLIIAAADTDNNVILWQSSLYVK